MIGKLKYGPEFMNIQGDRTQEGSLVAHVWDDEGVAADKWLIIEKGIFKDYQTTREQAAWISKLTGVKKSHGCSFADSWSSVQFQRMPNVSLLPGDKDIGLDDIVAATDRGIIMKNRGSWSIDHQRLQLPVLRPGVLRSEGRKDHRHAEGRRVSGEHAGVLEQHGHDRRRSSYWLGGSFGDGKGEPAQSNSVSHGCVPARFKQREHRQHREEQHEAPLSLRSASRRRLSSRASRQRRSPTRVLSYRESRRDARQHLERLERQHALRRRRDHDVAAARPTRPSPS